MKIKLTLCVTVGLFAAVVAGKDDPAHKYTGLSGCAAELKRAPGTYSIRLDKRHMTRLAAHTVNGKNVLAIVQYNADHDQCGVVRDAVQSDKPSDFFEFDCADQSRPSVVVVGTRSENDPKISGKAIRAWRVDLDTLTFAADDGEVTCVRRSHAGSDEGEDLATWAKKRAEIHQK